jgi:hypothetical protein
METLIKEDKEMKDKVLEKEAAEKEVLKQDAVEKETAEKEAAEQESLKKETAEKEPVKKPTQTNKSKKGIVFNCLVLNVRQSPDPKAAVATMIAKWDEVEVLESESTDEFYHVRTRGGITGFCMKSFIKI